MTRSSERGIALVAALFMTLILSVMGSSLMFVARTETLSSLNYKTMSQGRYGAESGVHVAANHLMFTYEPPVTAAELAPYDTTVTPVRFGGLSVVLSSDPKESNYPRPLVRDAFAAATKGTLNVQNGTVGYSARATLVSMRQVKHAFTGKTVTLQTWEITGVGTLPGAGSAEVEVSAVIDRQMVPAYRYAAFSTFNGCGSLSFAGGATTDSYDSTSALAGGVPALDESGGNVGSNGNLTDVGNPTTIWGTLSTPRSGVGACTANNVTAATAGTAPQKGLVELPQAVEHESPPPPDPMPPIGATDFGKNSGCPAGVTGCVASTNGATITPAGAVVTMGDVDLGSQAEIHLNAGTYNINSFTMNANSRIFIDSGPVTFNIAGQGIGEGEMALKITGNGISNPTYKPSDLQFLYGGVGDVDLAGGTETSALVYGPKATGKFTGGSDFYGAVVLAKLTAAGGGKIHYDRNLANRKDIPGNFTMNHFTWKVF
ncbi:MAG TPA: pilus assembly PilX N-terminal domain-containing protein [Vicinamibacterales bacterium]